jgi:hypothetical protein
LTDEVAQLQQQLTYRKDRLQKEAEERDTFQAQLDQLTQQDREQGNLNTLRREHENIQETIIVSKSPY